MWYEIAAGLFTILLLLLGGVCSMLYNRHARLEAKLNTLELDVAKNYVAHHVLDKMEGRLMDKLEELFERLDQNVNLLFEKLDEKQDKPR